MKKNNEKREKQIAIAILISILIVTTLYMSSQYLNRWQYESIETYAIGIGETREIHIPSETPPGTYNITLSYTGISISSEKNNILDAQEKLNITLQIDDHSPEDFPLFKKNLYTGFTDRDIYIKPFQLTFTLDQQNGTGGHTHLSSTLLLEIYIK